MYKLTWMKRSFMLALILDSSFSLFLRRNFLHFLLWIVIFILLLLGCILFLSLLRGTLFLFMGVLVWLMTFVAFIIGFIWVLVIFVVFSLACFFVLNVAFTIIVPWAFLILLFSVVFPLSSMRSILLSLVSVPFMRATNMSLMVMLMMMLMVMLMVMLMISDQVILIIGFQILISIHAAILCLRLMRWFSEFSQPIDSSISSKRKRKYSSTYGHKNGRVNHIRASILFSLILLKRILVSIERPYFFSSSNLNTTISSSTVFES